MHFDFRLGFWSRIAIGSLAGNQPMSHPLVVQEATMVADPTTAEETITAKADMRQVWALAEISRQMGRGMEFTLLSCDNPAALKHIVNGKSSDAPGVKNLAVATMVPQEATNRLQSGIRYSTSPQIRILLTTSPRRHLIGADAILRWAASEAQGRD